MFAEVVFNIPHNNSFFYRAIDGCQVGVRVRASLKRRVLTGYVIGMTETLPYDIPDSRIKDVEKVLDSEPLFSRDGAFFDMAKWVSSYYMCSLGEALAMMVPLGKTQRENPVPYEEPSSYVKHELTEEQKEAIETFYSSDSYLFYLYGITGSGKTEVYLSIAERLLKEENGSVLYLVPEISLTSQIVESMRNRFLDITGVAILHSRLSAGQRLNEWKRILSGEARLVIGARSAVFAPLKNLSLIILDEEHESSYKSGSTPRYHARQVAMWRARKEGARLIMGSATPSFEAYRMMRDGKLPFYALTSRVGGGAEPEMRVIHLKEFPGPLSAPLLEEIERTHKEGRQTILFLNRRGFAHYIQCLSCGYEMICRHCSVPLTYHEAHNIMICHYCGYRTRPIDVCPKCNSVNVRYGGPGTEQMEKELSRRFPFYRIRRLDTDTAAKSGYVDKVIDEMHRGEVDVLIGTQMIAKGLNFKKLGLVGVVLADTGLHIPDFRASERVFSLLMQVAGRAGRFLPDGKVIIQTYLANHPAIAYAKKNDLEGFYLRELKLREETNFPPFSRLIRVLVRGKKESRVKSEIYKLADVLRKNLPAGVELLGPSTCPMEMIAGNYRYHLFLRAKNSSIMHAVLKKVLSGFELTSGLFLEIDIDPVNVT
ncbi:primosomal protein N' [Spirochaetia bacterium 38H-sp]|uniref:Replication restart protein PriA n=1 Tax=Rarispira pelagica TaxID=3141764 RepID=A0ABU9UE23_9SPIR